MHVYFDDDGRPFILDSEMRWQMEPNAFLAEVSLVRGKTRSPKTWRSYAYQFGDWLSFCERIDLEWRRATELNLATYRNILASEASSQTRRALKRSTINHKLSVICQFYRFAQKKKWIEVLPFDLEGTRIPFESRSACDLRVKTGAAAHAGSSLRLTETKEELEIPPRRDVRRFIKSFQRWRDQLMAEIMWLTGMRCAEVCSLSLDDLPENLAAIEKETMAIKITGKGQKRRAVLFTVRLLRSVNRYVQMERRQRASSGKSCSSVFVGRMGKPLQTSAINRVFSTNCKRTGLKFSPHLLRHCYAVERLAYLQDIGAPNPLKTVQMELGHAHMATTERYLHLTERMRSDVIDAHNSFVDRLLEN
jgi:integrase/recombinase XerD